MRRTIDGLLEEVRSLKSSAKSARDDNEWAEAIADLEEAVALLREAPSIASAVADRGTIDAELADTYGQIGGIERRWGLELSDAGRREHLELSKDAYDKGFDLEQHLEIRVATTYNRINRLVGRVLLDPEVLEGVAVDSVDVLAELEVAERIVGADARASRQRDPWAYCDLGTVTLLRGGDWVSIIGDIERIGAPRFVYESWLSTLVPLSEVASAIRPALPELVVYVKRAIRHSAT